MLSASHTPRSQVIRCRMTQRAVDLTQHGAKRQASKPGFPGLGTSRSAETGPVLPPTGGTAGHALVSGQVLAYDRPCSDLMVNPVITWVLVRLRQCRLTGLRMRRTGGHRLPLGAHRAPALCWSRRSSRWAGPSRS